VTTSEPLQEIGAVRPDGATRGDKAEATALVFGGAAMLVLPFIAVLDRMGEGWFWLSVVAALGGAFVSGLGVRWFATEGPPLTSAPAQGHALCGGGAVDLPLNVRLVEARNRQRAHILRLVALASAVALLVVDVGPFKWAVIALFGLSFLADHVLLRPRRYVLDATGLHGGGVLAAKIPWTDVQDLYWRSYPTGPRPPFPSSERLIVERTSGRDVEFVFQKRYGGTPADVVVRAGLPTLGERVKVLVPKIAARQEVVAPVSQVLDASNPEPTTTTDETPS
jgi:hypothetical protein